MAGEKAKEKRMIIDKIENEQNIESLSLMSALKQKRNKK